MDNGPDGPRILMRSRTAVKRGAVGDLTGVRTKDSGREQRSPDRCALPVNPPRDRPSSEARSWALRVHAHQLEVSLTRAAASAITASISIWKPPDLAQRWNPP